MKENRTSIEVLKNDVVWAQDGTHIGRLNGEGIEAQVIKDRGSLQTIGIQVGLSATEDEILKQFECIKKVRPLPLVWMTDNGSCYIGERLKVFLDEEKIVHLRSSPRVPQHNAAAERCMCEQKVLCARQRG